MLFSFASIHRFELHVLLTFLLPFLSPQIEMYATEALSYLEARKTFWQQQKPVYARKNEQALKKAAIYGGAAGKQGL